LRLTDVQRLPAPIAGALSGRAIIGA